MKLSKSKIMCFAATTDGNRSKAFYQDLLGLTFVEDSQFAIVFDSDGIMLRIQKVAEHTPFKFTALGWEVDDILATINELAQKGIVFVHFDGFGQDEHGIWRAPDGTQVTWFNDPDGNILSLTEFAASA